MRITLAAMLAIALVGCSSDKPDDQASTDQTEQSQENDKASLAGDPASCARDEEGQIACLIAEFELENCDEARVLGSMFRDNAKEETHEHTTAFGLSNACTAELRETLTTRGFREEQSGMFTAKRYGGSRESVLIGLQISADGSVVEWERTKE